MTEDAGHRVDRSTIAHLENGRRSPLARTLKLLADAMSVPVDTLLREPPSQPTERAS